jgi:hypothetical protein
MKGIAILFVCLCAFFATGSPGAQAAARHHWRHHHQVVGWHHYAHRHFAIRHGHYRHYAKMPHHYRHYATAPSHSLVTVETAAGIPITVSPRIAPKMQSFIQALVARGYHPRHISCFATHGHVRGSLHYRGEACDFDQGGWGRTASIMYHVTSIAAQFGLRDGCTFHDCGHIDLGPPVSPRYYARYASHHHRYARYMPHYRRYARYVPHAFIDERGRASRTFSARYVQ